MSDVAVGVREGTKTVIGLTLEAVRIGVVDVQVVSRFWAAVLEPNILEQVSEDELRAVLVGGGDLASAMVVTDCVSTSPWSRHEDDGV